VEERAHRPNVVLTDVRFDELVDPSDLPTAEPEVASASLRAGYR